MTSITAISNLSSRSKFKAKMVHFSFILQGLNSFCFVISQKKPVGLHVFVLSLSILIAYKYRPSNMQALIDKWAAKGHFPIQKGSGLLLRVVLTISLIQQFFFTFKTLEAIDFQKVLMLLFALPLLFFVYDKELEKFIWKKQSSSKKGIASAFFYGALLILPYGFALCAKRTSERWMTNLAKCVESGGCMDKKTMICGPRVNGDPKMVCEIPQKYSSETQ